MTLRPLHLPPRLLRLNRYVQVLPAGMGYALFSLSLGLTLQALHANWLLDTRKFRHHQPLILLLETVILAPLLEEAIFRIAPIWIVRRIGADHYQQVFAVFLAFVFAQLHNSATVPGFHFPLIQFLFALIAGQFAYAYGARYAYLLHGLDNLTGFSIVALLKLLLHH